LTISLDTIDPIKLKTIVEYTLVSRLFPFFAIAIAIELMLVRHHRKQIYFWQESLDSLGIFLVHYLTQAIFIFVPAGLLLFAWQYRLFTIPIERWWSMPLLFISLEFCYYWYHRAAHTIRWLWATHAVHHSVRYFNLSAAYRLGWTSLLSGNIIFFMPISWLGFPPTAVIIGLSLTLAYQFWIHTELIPKLGVLEWIFNTPSHHRVHHAANSEYIDRNYGGVLIIFDRLFGTFAEEKSDRSIVYGLTHPLSAQNPFEIALHEWDRLFKDIFAAKTWRERLSAIFGAPV
jgi:sterol desaturase/sphingolipid hydroxylase (fatty acid hydroxylase superfamily)